MTTDTWFDDLPTIGKLPPAQAAAKLRELGDEEGALALEAGQDRQISRPATFGGWNLFERPWQHAAHAFGYIAPRESDSERTLSIKEVGNIPADLELQNSRIRITLNCLRIADYPGMGNHQILFDFYAQNQVPGNVEHLHFNSIYRVREGERAAILNYPIFIGLNVGNQGIAFKCFTVNVKNEEDEVALSFLESDVFKAGLKLTSTIQPAIAPLSAMAIGLTKAIAQHRKNVPVQDFYLGLDFNNNPMSARLAEGIYIAVQIPERETQIWEWNDWLYDIATGQIVNDEDRTELIPYNYIAFGISRYQE